MERKQKVIVMTESSLVFPLEVYVGSTLDANVLGLAIEPGNPRDTYSVDCTSDLYASTLYTFLAAIRADTSRESESVCCKYVFIFKETNEH